GCETRDLGMRIWIDGDACPRMVKEAVYKAALRLQIPTTLVANQPIGYPRSPLVDRVTVGKEIDAADRHIAAQATPGDLTVTADIPLAATLVGKGVAVIDPRGTVYS